MPLEFGFADAQEQVYFEAPLFQHEHFGAESLPVPSPSVQSFDVSQQRAGTKAKKECR